MNQRCPVRGLYKYSRRYPHWDTSYCIYTPGLRVIFWFFLMTQKEHALRHRVVAATAPGVATSYAFYCEPSAFEYAVLAQGLDGVL